MQAAQTILTQNKLLFINDMPDPQVVLDHVSPSRLVRHPTTGAEMVATRHTMRAVQQLHELGIYAPSPVLTDYKWTGRLAPMSHQKETADFLTRHFKALVLSDMGTGKTASALWSADYLMQLGIFRTVLVIAPLSCLTPVWIDEIWKWVPHRTGEVLHAARDKRKYLARRSKADFLLINHDGLGIVKDELIERGDIDLILYDEAAALRNASNDRYKLLRNLHRATNSALWLMTGTPTPNAPTDAWALARLVNPQGTEPSFKRFQDSTMWKVTPFKWRSRNNASIIVRKALQPAIRHRKEDCMDLPPITYTNREARMGPDQAKAFESMRKHMRAEAMADKALGVRHITAVNAAVRLSKLLQICCGSVYADDGSIARVPIRDRMDVLQGLIESSQSKTIVYIPFRATLDRVGKELTRRKITFDTVHGGVTGTKRDAVLTRFQCAVDPRVLLAQPRTAAHGLNLTVASTTVWFAPTFSSEQYQQANERMARLGQQFKMTIVHMGCHLVEWGAYRVVKDKGRRQSAILSLYEKIISNA